MTYSSHVLGPTASDRCKMHLSLWYKSDIVSMSKIWQHAVKCVVFENTLILHVFWLFGPIHFDDASEATRYNIRLFIITSTRCYI